jgi:hypothetical protein
MPYVVQQKNMGGQCQKYQQPNLPVNIFSKGKQDEIKSK